MTSAAETRPIVPVFDEEVETPVWWADQRTEGERYDVWTDRQGAEFRRYYSEAGSTKSSESFFVVSPVRPDTDHRAEVNVRQFGNILMMDFGETLNEFPDEHQSTVEYLWINGRPVLAGQLIEMLDDQEPDEAKINLVSLGEMARLLVEQGDFDDPLIGADRRGLVHAQWTIAGNGILIWGFLEDKRILMVAQADESSIAPDGLDINERLPAEKVLDTYGHLVPRRR